MPERIVELRRELASNPASRQFYQLGELLRRQGEAAEAAAVLRRGLEHHPRYVAAWVSLGRALVDLGDGEAADTALERALEHDPGNPVAWRLIGESRLLCNDRQGALVAMERALALVPGDEVLEAAVQTLRGEVRGRAAQEVPGTASDRMNPPSTAVVETEPEWTEPGGRGVASLFGDEGARPDGDPALPDAARYEPVHRQSAARPNDEPREAGTDDPFAAGDVFSIDESVGDSATPGGRDVWDVFEFAFGDAPAGEEAAAADQSSPDVLSEQQGNWEITVTVPPPEPRTGPSETGMPAGVEIAEERGEVALDAAHHEVEEEISTEPVSGAVFDATDSDDLGGPDHLPGQAVGAGVHAVQGPGRDSSAAAAPDLAPTLPGETSAFPDEAALAAPILFAPTTSAGEHAGSEGEQEGVMEEPAAVTEEEVLAGEVADRAGPTVTLARVFIQQQQLDRAVATLNEVIVNEPANQEARDLRSLVLDMMEPLDTPLPPLSARERKIAALQHWLASLTLGRDRNVS